MAVIPPHMFGLVLPWIGSHDIAAESWDCDLCFSCGMGGIAMFAINRYRCVGRRKDTLICVGNLADAVVAGIRRISGQGVNLAKL